ncbi:uncharacterized protein PV06_06433 [Exophiala oligosperma]|uniref:Uncharacterized protein n=1 Tax=Exophiala oligosperma TaxID=215243 RepID=A0A0D2BZS3_9EURO|nr:uncharacterized protein PV06_06433 [Exophiala oligosperma]KIW42937.1 hypothetical protein PV06_06433 [Exophiala oligosperma]
MNLLRRIRLHSYGTIREHLSSCVCRIGTFPRRRSHSPISRNRCGHCPSLCAQKPLIMLFRESAWAPLLSRCCWAGAESIFQAALSVCEQPRICTACGGLQGQNEAVINRIDFR